MTSPRWRWLTMRVMLAGRASQLHTEWSSAAKANKAPEWTKSDGELWAAIARGAGFEQAPMVHDESELG